ncbi:MAG: argininosuccinate lyase [Christensenellales bacterium]|jgi:argininosuccinate lyase
MDKLWKGRLENDIDKFAEEFNTSLPVDKAIYKQDISGSIAHAKMLGECKIISCEDAEAIVKGLEEIKEEIESGALAIENAEDIHTFIENHLTQKIGEAGKRLHTARSRNDQVVTDFKLYVISSIDKIKGALISLVKSLIKLAKEHLHTYMPGFTHLQKAQPVTLAFHLAAYGEMFYRDITRFSDALKRTNLCPLGSGALAGTTFGINREMTAKELGFAGVTANAMDSVSDRDFALEYLFCANTVFIHLSRLSEEIITWASNEYGYISLSDAYSTGSSIMPQKKNPDMAELIRGKSAKAIGALTSMLALLKGLPLAYNKDLQEDKGILLECEKDLYGSIVIMEKMLLTATFNKQRMLDSAKSGFINATDLADYLTLKGMPFRDAYKLSGKIVNYCIANNKVMEELTLAELAQFSSLFDQDVYQAIDIKETVDKRRSGGGTSPQAVLSSLEKLEERLAQY